MRGASGVPKFAFMFLRCNRRKKDGKTHDYWSMVESRRCSDGRVVQRQVLYLGEINASQREAWRKTIEVQDADTRRQVALFPAGSMPVDDVDAIGVLLYDLTSTYFETDEDRTHVEPIFRSYPLLKGVSPRLGLGAQANIRSTM